MKVRKGSLLAVVLFLVAAGAVARPGSGETLDTAIRDAIEAASMHEDRMVFRCKGESMLPLFGPGSMALARKTAFENIRPGMIAIYRDEANDLVAHRVMSSGDRGWTVKGQNNRRADREQVTEENFVGIVYAVFHTDGSGVPSDTLRVGEIPVVVGKSR